MSLQTAASLAPTPLLDDGRLRRIGRAIGALYLVADVCGVASMTLMAPLLDTDETSQAIATHPYAAPAAALAILAMGATLAFMPLVAYPVLAERSAFAARSYALLRSVLELGAYLAIASSIALLPALSGSMDDAMLSALADHDALTALTGVGFLGAAIVLYTMLLRMRLVPRWLPAWGLLATVPYLVGQGLVLFGVADATDPLVVGLLAALGVQEVALAAWLLVRGLRRPAADVRR